MPADQRTSDRTALRARARTVGDRMAARAVEGLYETLRSDHASATQPAAASFIASVLALCVHAATAAVAVLGLVVLVRSPSRLLGVAAGTILLGAAWLTRPRPAAMPMDVHWVESEPLAALVGQVASATGARPPHRIGFDDQLNATYAVVQWRRRRVLVIGMPLWESLDPQARVSLLAHEMGHAAARDDRHLLLVSTALEALREWMRVCRYQTPVRRWDEHLAVRRRTGSLAQLGELLSRALLGVVGLAPAAWYGLLLAVTQRSSQRAEYGADLVAADVAGREATVRALSTVMEHDALVASMRRTAMRSDRDVLSAVRATGETLAVTGWPGRRSRPRLGAFDSHPPDQLRRSLVQSVPVQTCRIVLNNDAAARIDAGLAGARAWANRRVYDGFQAR
jgi:Zn-dependent protease with chaperone function